MEIKEIWKDIEGYENLYQVSNLGRVKSLPKKVINPKGGKCGSESYQTVFNKDGVELIKRIFNK